MLDLSAGTRPLHAYHQRFLDDDLPAALSRAAFAAFDRTRYTERDLEIARRSWTLRALDEYRSLTAFTSLLADLAQVDCGFDALGVGVRIVRDEDRHVELCRRLVVALGGSSRLEGEPAWLRTAPWASPRERVLRMVVGSLCIGETLSVRFLAAVRDATADPLAREVATCLVADESVHGRFGWELLGAMLPGLSARELCLVRSLLPGFYAQVAASFRPAFDASKPDPRPSPFGSLSPRARAALFDDAFRTDVVARFTSLGLTPRRSFFSRLLRTPEVT